MRLVTIALLMVALCGVSVLAQPAEMIVTGNIHTMNAAQPRVAAVAVRGGRIVAAGALDEVNALRGSGTRSIELGRHMMIPGLVDAHAHIMNLGRYLSNVDLMETKSVDEIRKRVAAAAAERSPDTWIRGRGWDQNDWPETDFPNAADLDGIPNPVYLKRVDGHAGWANRRALELAGVTRDSKSPAGGKIILDDRGEPTGVFIDNAKELVEWKIPEPSQAEKERLIRAAVAECHKYGLVGVHEAGTTRDAFDIFTRLSRSGELDLRLYCMLDAYTDSVFSAERLAAGTYADDYVTVRALKLYVDGALGSRGAVLLEPYSDDPENVGLYRNDAASLAAWAGLAVNGGYQVCSHAIGDAGNRTALDVYEKLIAENGLEDHRWRIEHAQVVSLPDIPRFARHGIIAAMQPTHCTSDMYWAEERVGPERIRGAYAWRMFLDFGATLALGSDFPVEGVNPLWGIYAAVTRKDHEDWPQGGWYPDQRLTVLEAVRGFTSDAAYASFSESVMGTIEVGKLADFTVLDRDLFAIDPQEILDAKVVMTIVGGEVVYEASN